MCEPSEILEQLLPHDSVVREGQRSSDEHRHNRGQVSMARLSSASAEGQSQSAHIKTAPREACASARLSSISIALKADCFAKRAAT